jgi:hypothetical protein
MFVLRSDISIGNLRFEGVQNVVIKRSVHSLIETAIIEVPAIAYMQEKGKTAPKQIVTATQIVTGSEVRIQLGYNGEMRTEFEGYVVSSKPGTPVQIICEGASYLLRQNVPGVQPGKTTIKELMQSAVSKTTGKKSIKVSCALDMPVLNTCSSSASGLEIINELVRATKDNLCCFFIKPYELWCGLLYSDYTSGIPISNDETVRYRIGFNTLKENTLEEHASNVKAGTVEYKRKSSTGEVLMGVSVSRWGGATKETAILNKILQEKSLAELADEKAIRYNYKGYEGDFTGFLQPYVAPGGSAKILNSNKPEMDGVYLIESTEVTFGVNGARRKIELGPGFETIK